MHYFLEKLIILKMKTEKHPVAMKKYVLRRIFLYSLSSFEFMHYFLEKRSMLIIKTEKHPVAIQIFIAI